MRTAAATIRELPTEGCVFKEIKALPVSAIRERYSQRGAVIDQQGKKAWRRRPLAAESMPLALLLRSLTFHLPKTTAAETQSK